MIDERAVGALATPRPGLTRRAPEHLRRMALYVLTGGSAAVVDLGAFGLLTQRHVSIPVAAVASFCLAALVNYVLTSLVVFRRPLSLGRLASFLVFAVIGLGVNVGVTLGVVALTHAPALIAKTAGIGVAFFANFWLNAAFVFRRSAGR